uniref:Uncharacterized protein n=1 Tax=Trichogramma kaykai TaxID=54128 RepID=A0ABD2X8R1_9HYME
MRKIDSKIGLGDDEEDHRFDVSCREPRCQARACVYTRNITTRAAAIGAVELANVAVRVRARALVQCSRSHNDPGTRGGALWETSGAEIYTSTIENSTRTERADILIIAKYSAITRRAHEPRRRHLRRDFISVAAKAIGIATDSRDRNSYARELRTKQFSSCIVRVFIYKTCVLAGFLCVRTLIICSLSRTLGANWPLPIVVLLLSYITRYLRVFDFEELENVQQYTYLSN